MNIKFILYSLLLIVLFPACQPNGTVENLEQGFLNPPDSARPGVYWYFMDGNLSKESVTKDLEAMKEAGIGYVVYLKGILAFHVGKLIS